MMYIKPHLSGAGTGASQTAASGSQTRQQPGKLVPAAMNGRDTRAHDAASSLIQYGQRLSPGPFASHGLETTADPLGRLTHARDLAYTLAVATGHSSAEAMRVATTAVGGAHAVCFVTDGAPVDAAPSVKDAADIFAQPPRASTLVSGLDSDPDIFDAVVGTSCREGRSFSEIIANDYSHLSRTEQRVLNREVAAVMFSYVTVRVAYEAVQSLRGQLASARVEEVGQLRAQLRAHVEHYQSLLSLVDGMQTQVDALSAAQTAAQTAVTTFLGAKGYLGGELPAALDALGGFVEQASAVPAAFAALFERIRASAPEISALAAAAEDHAPHPAVIEAAQGRTHDSQFDLDTIHKPATQTAVARRMGERHYEIAVRLLQEWAPSTVSQEILEAALTYALGRLAEDAQLLDLMLAATVTITTYLAKLAEIDAATDDTALRAQAMQLLIAHFRAEKDLRGLNAVRLLRTVGSTVDDAEVKSVDVEGATAAGGDAGSGDSAAGHRDEPRDEPQGPERDDAAATPGPVDVAPPADAVVPVAATSSLSLTRAVPLSQVTRAAVDAKIGEGAEQYVLERLQAHPLVQQYGMPSVLLTVLIRYTACQPKLSTLGALYHEVVPWLDSFESKHVPCIDGLLGTGVSPRERSAVMHYLFAKIAAYLLDGYRLFQVLRQYPTWIPEACAAIAANPAASVKMLDALQARIDQLESSTASAPIVVDAATAAIVPAVSDHVVAIPAKARSEHPIYQLAELLFGFAHNGPYGSTGRVHQAIFHLLFRGTEAGAVGTEYWAFLYRSFLRIRRRVDAHYGIAKDQPMDDAVAQLRTLTTDQATDRQWRIAVMIGSIKAAMMDHKKHEFPEKDAIDLVITQTLSALHLTGAEADALLARDDAEPAAAAGTTAWDAMLGAGADAVVAELMSHVPAAIKGAVRVTEWQRLLALPDYEALPLGYRWRALHQVILDLQSGKIKNGDSERLLQSSLNAWGESNAAVIGELLGVKLSSLKTPPYLPSSVRNEVVARAMAEAKTFDWDVTTSPLGTPVSFAAARLNGLIETFAGDWRPQSFVEAIAVLRSGDIEDVDNETPNFHVLTTVPAGLPKVTYAPILIAAVGRAMTESWNAARLQAHVNAQVAAALPPAPEPEPPAPEPTGDAGTVGPTTSDSEAASASAAPAVGTLSFTLDPAAVARKRAQDDYRAQLRNLTGRLTVLRDDPAADKSLVAEEDGNLVALQAAVERGEFDEAALRKLVDDVDTIEELKG